MFILSKFQNITLENFLKFCNILPSFYQNLLVVWHFAYRILGVMITFIFFTGRAMAADQNTEIEKMLSGPEEQNQSVVFLNSKENKQKFNFLTSEAELYQGTGTNSVAIGSTANASAREAIAIGHNSQSTGESAIVMGDGAKANFALAIAIGATATAENGSAVAIGSVAKASANSAVALGDHTVSSGDQSVAIGHAATTRSFKTTVIGADSLAGGEAVVVGAKSKADASYAVAVGYDIEIKGVNSVAVGNEIKVADSSGVAIGKNVAINGSTAVAVGTRAKVTASSAIAIGSDSSVSGIQSLAIGHFAQVTHDSSIAIGDGAKVTANNAIALGAGSVADRENTISLGSSYKKNKLVNLGDAALNATSTDAVTGKQLYKSNQAILALQNDLATKQGKLDEDVNLVVKSIKIGTAGPLLNSDGLAMAGKTITGLANGTVSATSTDAVTGKQLYKSNRAIVILQNHLNGKQDKLDENADIVVRSVKIGANGPSLSNTGLVLADKKITGLADGILSATSTDAITGRQLYNLLGNGTLSISGTDSYTSLTQAFLAVGTKFAETNAKIDQVNETLLYSGITKKKKGNDKKDESPSKLDVKDKTDNTVKTDNTAKTDNTDNTDNTAKTDDSANIDDIIDGFADDTAKADDTDGLDGFDFFSLKDKKQKARLLRADYKVKKQGAIAIGDSATALGYQAIAIGASTIAEGDGSVAIGDSANGVGVAAVAIGKASNVLGQYGIAVGNGARAMADTSTAIGLSASTTGTGSIAIGNDAKATAKNAIALGAGSVADRENTISLGSAASRSRLVNLADGELSATSSDAVTGRQFYKLLGNGTFSITGTDHYTSISDAFLAVGTKFSGVNLEIDEVYKVLSYVQEKQERLERAIADTATKEEMENIADQDEPIVISRLKSKTQTVSLLSADSDDHAKVEEDSVQSADRFSNNSATSIAVKSDDQGNKGRVFLSSEGKIEEGSMDPISGGQVYVLKNKIDDKMNQMKQETDARFKQVGSEMASLSKNVQEISRDVKGAGAMGVAAGAIRYDDRPGKFSLGIGMGYWKGASAASFGGAYTTSSGRARMNVAGSTVNGSFALSAGIAFTLN